MKVTAKKPTEKELAEARVVELQASVQRIGDALTQARLAEQAAEDRHVSCSDDEVREAREALDDVRKRRKSLEATQDGDDHKRNVAQLTLARRHLADVLIAEKRGALDALRPRIAAFGDEIASLASKFVTLDREAEQFAAAIAEVTSAHQGVFASAKALAADLRIPLAEIGEPADRVEVALIVRKAITAARVADGAEHRQSVVEHYLHGAPTDWRTEGMSARDLEDLGRVQGRNAAIERDRQRAEAFAAGVAAGRAPAPEPPLAPKQEAT